MKNGDIKTINNNYGLYENKDKVIENAKLYIEELCNNNELNLTTYKKKSKINNRSISAKCNHLNIKIEHDEIVKENVLIDIIRDCIKYNMEDYNCEDGFKKGFKDIKRYLLYGKELGYSLTDIKDEYIDYKNKYE